MYVCVCIYLYVYIYMYIYSYEGKLEAIKIATEYVRDISPSNDSLHIFSDCQSAISTVTSQNRENYHNSTP